VAILSRNEHLDAVSRFWACGSQIRDAVGCSVVGWGGVSRSWVSGAQIRDTAGLLDAAEGRVALLRVQAT
jgi:hypothetical protein